MVRLAGALHHQAAGLEGSAVQLYDSARSVLAGLPPVVLRVDVARLRQELPATVTQAQSTPPDIPCTGRRPRGALLRFGALLALLLSGFLLARFSPLGGYLKPEILGGELEELSARGWAPWALIGLYVVLSPIGVPASALVVAGGFVFGTVLGGLYNVAGTFLGAAASFFLGRLLGRDFVAHVAGRRLARVERRLARLSFWALVRVRFLPVPFPLVNYGAALTGVPAGRFLAASALGLTPAVLLYTWFAAALARAAQGERGPLIAQLVAALAGVLLLSLLPPWLEARRKRRRLAELRTRRGRRPRRGAPVGIPLASAAGFGALDPALPGATEELTGDSAGPFRPPADR